MNEIVELQESVIDALRLLIQYDSELIKNQPREECINHKLVQYLEAVLIKKKILTKHDVDLEYNKYKENEKKMSNGRYIRPDILVHERRSGNRNNLIAIEAKKGYSSCGDKKKIKNLVENREKFSYAIGVTIAYLPGKDYVKINFLLGTNNWQFYRLNKKNFSIKKVNR